MICELHEIDSYPDGFAPDLFTEHRFYRLMNSTQWRPFTNLVFQFFAESYTAKLIEYEIDLAKPCAMMKTSGSLRRKGDWLSEVF